MHNPEKETGEIKGELELVFTGDEFILPSDTRILEPVRNELERRLLAAGWVEEKIEKVLVAVDEAITNAVKHGNKNKPEAKVYIRLTLDNLDFKVVIRDEGSGIPDDQVPDPRQQENITKADGRGIFLMKQLSDKTEFNGPEVILYFKNDVQIN
ncbi:MAG: ATP-binding protein [Patescibacteria group bacterium]